MGFNPRLAPYSVTWQVDPFVAAAGTIDSDWFRFPAAGEVLAAYGTVSANIATDTTTAITTLAIGKSAAGTGAYTAVASRVVTAGSNGTSTYDNTTQYTLTNSTTLANMQFAAGDWAMVRRITAHGASATSNDLNVQMDYVIGYDSGTTPTAATGPA